MISDLEFIRQSLELNLFFMRIAKEHAIFLGAAILPVNANLALEADDIKDEFSRLLAETIFLSNGIIDCDVLSSRELVTDTTIDSERISEYYTGICIDSNITNSELSLECGKCPSNIVALAQEVFRLNERAIAATNKIIRFKSNLLRNVLACKVFTFNYPLLIEHILREAVLYKSMLTKLQNRTQTDVVDEMIQQEIFWNRIMAEHAKFIRGLLDPTEEKLFNTSNDFGKEFDKLTEEATKLIENKNLLPQVTKNSLNATKEIRDFKKQGTEGLIGCNIRSVLYPLLGDHVLREANHYIRILKDYKM